MLESRLPFEEVLVLSEYLVGVELGKCAMLGQNAANIEVLRPSKGRPAYPTFFTASIGVVKGRCMRISKGARLWRTACMTHQG